MITPSTMNALGLHCLSFLLAVPLWPAAARAQDFAPTAPPLEPELVRYQLDTSVSKVGFDGRSTLHDWTAETSALEGFLVSGFPNVPAISGGRVVAQAAELDSDNGLRDDEMRSRLEVKQFPELGFDLVHVLGVLAANGEATGTRLDVEGRFLLHGVARNRRFALDCAREHGGLRARGRLSFPMSEHGVTPPDMLVVTVQDSIDVWFDLLWKPIESAPLTAQGLRLGVRSAFQDTAGQQSEQAFEARLFGCDRGALLEFAPWDLWLVSTALEPVGRGLEPTRLQLSPAPRPLEDEVERTRAKWAEAKAKFERLNAAQRARVGASLTGTIERLERALALAPEGAPRWEADADRRALYFGETLWLEYRGRALGSEPERGQLGPLLAGLPGLPEAAREELRGLDHTPSSLVLLQLESGGRRRIELEFQGSGPALLPSAALEPGSWCRPAAAGDEPDSANSPSPTRDAASR